MCVQVRDEMRNIQPDDLPIPYDEVQNPCRTSYGYPENGAGSTCSLSTLTLLLTLALGALLAH